MTTDALNLSETRTWLPLDGLAPGFDTAKADLTDSLVGRTFTTVDDGGARTAYRFAADAVEWSAGSGEWPRRRRGHRGR